MSDYSQAWSDYRKLRMYHWLLIAGFFPVVVGSGLVSGRFANEDAADAARGVFGIAWVLCLSFVGFRTAFWQCPRCGQMFGSLWWPLKGTLFTQECVHCGLKKFAGDQRPTS